MSLDEILCSKPFPDKTPDKCGKIPFVRSTSERDAPGCHRRRQTGVPSELRYKTQLSNWLVVSWALVRVQVRIRVRLIVY